jgi:hypothetical protein
MAGTPFINQLFQLISNDVGTFLDPLDLLDLDVDMILEDGTSGKLYLAVMGHPGTIDGYDPAGTNAGITNSSAHAGAPDYGFLDTKKGWKWAGAWQKYLIEIDADEYMDPTEWDFGYDALDWLQDPDNLGGNNESDDYGIDERGWVYVDNEDDDEGLTHTSRIIKGNIKSSSITHVRTEALHVGNMYELWAFTGFNFANANTFDPVDLTSSGGSMPYSTTSYFATMFWECNITNFYDTMMNGISMMSYSHLIGDMPAAQTQDFWDYAGASSSDMTDYSTVNENIILDYENVDILAPRLMISPDGNEYTDNPGHTSWYYEGDMHKSYHSTDEGDDEWDGFTRDTDGGGYSTPSLTLGIQAFNGDTTAAISKLYERFRTISLEHDEYTLHLHERCIAINQSLYSSILSKKFAVKMQTSAGLSAQDRIGLTGPTTSQSAEMAIAEHLSATTSTTTSPGMASSPSSTGPSGYGGY